MIQWHVKRPVSSWVLRDSPDTQVHVCHCTRQSFPCNIPVPLWSCCYVTRQAMTHKNQVTTHKNQAMKHRNQAIKHKNQAMTHIRSVDSCWLFLRLGLLHFYLSSTSLPQSWGQGIQKCGESQGEHWVKDVGQAQQGAKIG